MLTTRGERLAWRCAQGLGFAAMLFVPHYRILVFSTRDARLHSPAPLASVALAPAIDIAVLGLAIALGLLLLRRTPVWPAARLALAIALPGLLFWRDAALIPWPPRPRSLFLAVWPRLALWHWPPRIGVILAGVAVWAALLILARFRTPRLFSRVTEAGGVFAAGLGVFALIVCVELVRISLWTPGPKEFHPSAVAAAAVSPSQPHARLVWIVFDELGQDQSFEHRAPSLALPHFDALRSVSTLYARVAPAGDATSAVLPALFLGEPVARADYSSRNRLLVRGKDGGDWHPFDAERSLFASARRRGWTTAIAGWWNPYCPVFAGVVDDCYWANYDSYDPPMALMGSLWQNVAAPFRLLAKDVEEPGSTDWHKAAFRARQHLASFEDLRTRTLALIHSSNADFLFLHLPLPHPPGIYDRRTQRLAGEAGHSYIDNLALADIALGEMMHGLVETPRWPETTLIVNGDHSWRTNLWRSLPGWTREDETASRGIFDDRPLVLIRHAGQVEPEEVRERWKLLELHGVIEGLLQGPAPGGTLVSGTGTPTAPRGSPASVLHAGRIAPAARPQENMPCRRCSRRTRTGS